MKRLFYILVLVLCASTVHSQPAIPVHIQFDTIMVVNILSRLNPPDSIVVYWHRDSTHVDMRKYHIRPSMDINGDGRVDFRDILDFTAIIHSRVRRADWNKDGVIDSLDTEAFKRQYEGGK